MINDHKKSEYALKTALAVKDILDKQFDTLIDLVDAAETGEGVDKKAVDGLFKEMSLAMESVNAIEKVMTLPAKEVTATIDKVETRLQSQKQAIIHM